MERAISLDDLFRIPNPAAEEFGSKAVWLAILNNSLSEYVNNQDFSTVIPNGFDVPPGVGLYHPSVREEYQRLTRDFRVPKIILARSNHSKESPGDFKTYPSLFSPDDHDTSFQNWLKAAQRVIESGADSVIGQVLAADLADYICEWGNIKDENGYGYHRVPSKIINGFGFESSGFFINSTTFSLGDFPSIIACVGLPSKIARGDDDVCCLISKSGWYRKTFFPLHNYHESSPIMPYRQVTLDGITFEDTGSFVTLKRDEDSYFGLAKSKFEGKFIPLKVVKPLYPEDVVSGLFGMIDFLRKRLGSEVEVEGIVNNNIVYFVQLRQYELPEKKLRKLTSVPADRVIYLDDSRGLGWNRLQGDLVVSFDPVDVPPGKILVPTRTASLEELARHPQLVIPFESIEHHSNPAAHKIGATIQKLWMLDKQGVQAVAVDDDLISRLLCDFGGRLPHGRIWEGYGPGRLFRDVTVECTGTRVQIYFNE